MPRFGRILSAMVSPFTDSGALDLDGAAKLAQWLVAHGNEGLVIAGTTGEAPTLTHEEHIDLVAAVADAVDVPVVAGTGSNSTAEAIDLTVKATAAGADGVLVVTPYYNRPNQTGIEAHFRAVAESTDLPVIVYDIPVRTGRKIETEVLLRMAHEVDNIVALKDAAGDPGETAHFIREAPEGFEVYSGDDILTLPFLSVGAVGVIGVATHWTGSEHQKMFDAWESGDVKTAIAMNQRMLPSFGFETGDIAPNPIPTKAMLRVLGLPGGHGRPPMNVSPDGIEDEARQILDGVDLGEEA